MAVISPKTIVISTIPAKRPLSSVSTTFTYTTSPVIKEELNIGLLEEEDEFMEHGPRKRKRLTHLTPEERMMRRKLKNRVAAQTARDRKKMKMQELEEALTEMEAENKHLRNENSTLKLKTNVLRRENTTLREKLGQPSSGDGAQCTQEGSLESAEGVDPPCLPGHLAPTELPAHVQPDLLDLLQEIVTDSAQTTEESQEIIVITDDTETCPQTDAVKVVGPSATELESFKELIHFDHEYYKTSAPSPVSTEPQEMTTTETEEVKSEPDTTSSSDIQTINMSEVDLASFLQQNMDSLMDFEALLAEEKVQDSGDKISLDSEDKSICSTSTMVDTNSVIDSSQSKDIMDTDVFNFGEDFGFVPSPPQTIVQDNKISPSFSESGYGSEFSDIGSPNSDASLFGDQDWEESFTELFPSLA